MPAELQTYRHNSTLTLSFLGANPTSLLQADMYAAVIETLSNAESDRSVTAIVLNGLEGLSSSRRQPLSDTPSEPLIEHLNDWVDTLQSFPKPVIAAVNGEITGPALSLMLACDLIVASAASTMNASSTPTGGISWLLTQGLPHQLAMEMTIATTPVSASRLYNAGLINCLVDDGAAYDTALIWAQQLASDKHQIGETKNLLREARQASLTQQFAMEAKVRLKS